MSVVVTDVDRHHEENCLWVMLHHHQQHHLWHTVVYQVRFTVSQECFICEIMSEYAVSFGTDCF